MVDAASLLALAAGAGAGAVVAGVARSRHAAAESVARAVSVPVLARWGGGPAAGARSGFAGFLDRVATRVKPFVGGGDRIARKLRWAGWSATPEQFVAYEVLAAGGGAAVGVLVGALLGHGAALLLVPVGVLAGWSVPGELLDRRYRAARGAVGREALGFGDFLVAAVQAGMPLEQALIRLGREMPGRLPQMLARAAREGLETKEGVDATLSALASEIGEPTVTALVGAITQARATGGELAGPLSGLLHAMRTERQNRLREQIRGRAATGFMPMLMVFLPGVLVPIAYVVWKALSGAGF